MNQPANPGVVLMTGAAGHVGSRLVPILSERFCLRLTDRAPGEIGGLPVEAVDLLDFAAVVEAFRGATSVIHSAIASWGRSSPQEYEQQMLEVNIKGAYHVFEAARLLGIAQVVYISSLTVATGHGPASDLSVSRGPKPVNLYACTKLFGEQVAELYSRTHGLRVISLRLGQPYPLGIPQEEAWRKDPVACAGFVTFADIARAIECALKATDVKMGIYNVVSRSSPQLIDCSGGKEIGFEPCDDWRDVPIPGTAS